MEKKMNTKFIKIKDLKEGMKIKTLNERGEIVFKKVTKIRKTEVSKEDRYVLYFDNGTILRCSENHPIMINYEGNIIEKYPLMISINDKIVTDSNVFTRLLKIEKDNNDKDYYDIEVEETNTFFCSSEERDEQILTHNSQGGVRGGAGTLYFVIWHYEIEDMLVLKNNKGTENNRIRHLDYGVMISRLFYERLIQNKNITLFSPHENSEMYEAFFNDEKKFKKLYELAEKNPNIRKKTIKAKDLFSLLMQERKDTGRIYILNVDHANTHSSFMEDVAPIRMSNLCLEITLPTVPLRNPDCGYKKVFVKIHKDKVSDYKNWRKEFKNLIPEEKDIKENYITIVNDIINEKIDKDNYEYFEEKMMDLESGSIALCTLSAINWGKINKKEEFEKYCKLAVRGLDALLSYQDYPLYAAENNTMCYRPLGIGIIGFAHWLAKNDIKYTEPNLDLIDEFAEAWSYYLIKESVNLAKEKGPCLKYYNTKYSKGILPIDTYKKEVDELVPHKERMNWKDLREELKIYGIRNATLMALMPSESSSQLANETNGIEPPRSYVSVKQSKEGVLKQVVPDFKRLKNKYELLWDQKSPQGYIKICAVLQKYIDQTISANTSYNPMFFKDEKIPMSVLLKDLMMCYRYGLKTLYYFNTYDGQGEIDVNKLLKSKEKKNLIVNEIEEQIRNNYEENSKTNAAEDEKCDSCVL